MDPPNAAKSLLHDAELVHLLRLNAQRHPIAATTTFKMRARGRYLVRTCRLSLKGGHLNEFLLDFPLKNADLITRKGPRNEGLPTIRHGRHTASSGRQRFNGEGLTSQRKGLLHSTGAPRLGNWAKIASTSSRILRSLRPPSIDRSPVPRQTTLLRLRSTMSTTTTRCSVR